MDFHITTYPAPTTFEEACEQVRDLERKADACIRTIREQRRNLVISRFRQGRAVDAALPMERAQHYGEGAVGVMAQRAEMSASVLYRALEFYRHPHFQGSEAKLLTWMDQVEEEKGAVTWSYCRNFAQKALPEGPDKAEKKLEREIHKLEKDAERLEGKALDLEREVIRWNGPLRDEGLGVVAKAREVASDLAAQRFELRKPVRLESAAYLAYIRGKVCLVCDRAPVEAHHLDRGGMGTKGPDFFTVPLCPQCHGHLHELGEPTFWRTNDWNPWKSAAEFMLEFFESGAATGYDVPVDFEYDD